jgi:hypothetical protein
MLLWGGGWLEVSLAKPPSWGIVGFQVGRPMCWIHRCRLNAVFVEIGFDPGFQVLECGFHAGVGVLAFVDGAASVAVQRS